MSVLGVGIGCENVQNFRDFGSRIMENIGWQQKKGVVIVK